jgi:hypothetical protein
MFKTSYKILLSLTFLAAAGGIITLLPNANASYPNILGYKSICTFAPAASFFCFFIAGSICFIRSTYVKDISGTPSERFKTHAKRLIPLAVILALGLASFSWYLTVKIPYIDAESGATSALLPAASVND